jgi:tRNA threonylcarbamoyladenosine biosynthesis protein TsaB
LLKDKLSSTQYVNLKVKTEQYVMALILHLETSTKVCSVALSQDGIILFSKADRKGPSHAVELGLFVDEALSFAENKGLKLEAVSVSSGPGSFTGLRIGVSMAKGLCYGLGIPLIAVPTLDLLADEVCSRLKLPDDALIRPMLDARRMEVYTALYDAGSKCLEPANALIVNEDSFSEILAQHPGWFVGDGSEKCQSKIKSENAHFEEEVYPLAEGMVRLAEQAYQAKEFVDVAYFEPFYLKEFVATVSKKQLIPTK